MCISLDKPHDSINNYLAKKKKTEDNLSITYLFSPMKSEATALCSAQGSEMLMTKEITPSFSYSNQNIEWLQLLPMYRNNTW